MPVVQVLAFFYRGRKQSNLSSLKIGCKGTTKNAHTQAKRALFSKKIDFCLSYKTNQCPLQARLQEGIEMAYESSKAVFEYNKRLRIYPHFL